MAIIYKNLDLKDYNIVIEQLRDLIQVMKSAGSTKPLLNKVRFILPSVCFYIFRIYYLLFSNFYIQMKMSW